MLGTEVGTSQKPSHNNFDSIRLILAVLVIFSHAFPLARGTNATEPLYALTGQRTTLGDLSVWGFFVISGFLITQSWYRSGTSWSYLKRRIGRIYPGFIVLSLVSLLVILPIFAEGDAKWPVTTGQFVVRTLRLLEFDTPPIFTDNPFPNVLNGSLWSIPFEFWCYIFVLVAGICGFLRYRLFLVALLAEFVAWNIYIHVTGYRPGGKIFGEIFGFPVFWAVVFPFFLAGSLFHMFGGEKLVNSLYALAALLIVIVSYLFPYGPMVTLPTFGAYVLLCVAYQPRLFWLNLGRYGDFSYGVYLYAFPIEQILEHLAHGRLSPLLLFVLALPASLLVAVLSWFGVERHFLSRSSRLKHEARVA